MKKYRKILLLIVTILLIIPVKNVYAYKLNKISNINNAPRIKGKRTIYITNMNNYEVTIKDKKNFKKIGTTIGIIEKLKSSKQYNNPYSVKYKNAGYYIDDNGDTVYVNVIVNANSVYIYLPRDYSNTVDHYTCAYLNKSNFEIHTAARDRNDIGISLGNNYVGQHSKLTFTIQKSDGTPLDSSIASNMMIPWYIWDIDVSDVTTGISSYDHNKTYVESIKFKSGFDNNTYVYNKSILYISENNSRYSATALTGDTGQPASDYSTVVTYQTSPSATIEWWGSGCGTSLQIRASSFDYPYMKNSTKEANKNKYNVGETVSYTIKQKFPYTISSNMAKSIILTDEFDKDLDISKITYKVLNKNNTDVSNSWKLNKSDQKVTLTYKETNFTNVIGEYTFIFDNIIIKKPSGNHQTIKMSEID